MNSKCMQGRMKREYDGRCHITEQQIARIRELRAAGMSLPKIAGIVGVSVYSAWFYTLEDTSKYKYVHKKPQFSRSLQTYYKRKALWEAGIAFTIQEEDE